MYLEENFKFDDGVVLENKEIVLRKPIELVMPEPEDEHDFENSKIIYDAYKNITPTQATDMRIWTYLSHATFWKYMKAKHQGLEQPEQKKGDYILKHWFVKDADPAEFLSQDIALLWWAAHLTYDETNQDSYELTKEMFMIPDYTKILLPGIQSKNTNFIHALLEFVKERPDLFYKNKEKKLEYLMQKSNYLGGYKVLPALSKSEIKDILKKYENEIKEI